MTKPNYQIMTESELREYVRRNPQDEDAFQYYLGIIRSRPGVVHCKTSEEADTEMRRRTNQ